MIKHAVILAFLVQRGIKSAGGRKVLMLLNFFLRFSSVHLRFTLLSEYASKRSSIFMYRYDELIYSICVGAHLHDISIILTHKSSVMIDVRFQQTLVMYRALEYE